MIISDVNMPRMDGFSFIKTIREQEAYRDIPILVLSTEGQDKDIQEGMNLGRQHVHGQTGPAGENGEKRQDAARLMRERPTGPGSPSFLESPGTLGRKRL